MFKKLHLQMTFFCTLITSLILVGLSFACLSISERGTAKNSFVVFQNNINSLLAYLENQTTISHHWILQLESGSHFCTFLYDNGTPLSFNSLNHAPDLEDIREQAIETARKEQGIDLNSRYTGDLLAKHAEFSMDGRDGREYYISAALLPRKGGILSVVTLYCLDTTKAALLYQRLLFVIADAAAIFLLAAFSWFFTGRMIRPLREGRKRQMQFIASASHELRSPLTVMLTSLSAMQIAKKEDADAFACTIQSEGERMSRLIDDMLSLAGADSGTWSIHPSAIELDTLLLQTYEKFEALALQKGLSLSVELPDDGRFTCICDGERIAQVLSILVDNALSYTPAGGKILLSLSCEGSHHFLRVADNGPGIHGEARAQIFERFYRADKSHKDKDHFGLGLCIANEIVKLHKGKLYLEDTPGGGATFVVSLPLYDR